MTDPPGTHWLVDGMNVIGSRPTGWWRDREGAMVALVGELGDFVRATEDEVTVVLDAKPFPIPGSPRVGVVFAERGGRDAADDEIVRMVERVSDPERYRVVTSDGDLRRRVTELGASVVSAGAFRRKLESGKDD